MRERRLKIINRVEKWTVERQRKRHDGTGRVEKQTYWRNCTRKMKRGDTYKQTDDENKENKGGTE